MGAIQKHEPVATELVKQLDVERALSILESSRDIEELRLAKGHTDVILAAARASAAVRANAQVMALCESSDLRFRRTLGEILARMPKAEGAKGRGKKADESAVPVGNHTLSEAGITKKESSQCQRLASLSASAFNAAVKEGVATGKLPTVSSLLKLADDEDVRRLSSGLTPDALKLVAGLPMKPRDVKEILAAGAEAEPAKRALAEKQVASKIATSKRESEEERDEDTGDDSEGEEEAQEPEPRSGPRASVQLPAIPADPPTPAVPRASAAEPITETLKNCVRGLTNGERAELFRDLGVVPAATLASLQQQRDADDEYHSWRQREADIKTKFGASRPQLKIDFVLAGGELALALLGLDYTVTPEKLAEVYKAAALSAHPDREGGNATLMSALNQAHAIVRAFVEAA